MTGSKQPANKATPVVAAQGRSLAYLVSTYVGLSMVFVAREVRQLRALGFNIDVASINLPDRPADKLTVAELDEAKRTYFVKRDGLAGAVTAHLQIAVTRPAGYLRGINWAIKLAGLDPRRLLFNLFYFTEALMVGRWMQRKQQSHLHIHLGSQAATVGLFVHHVFGFGYSITFHGPDEFYDARGQYLREKIAAAKLICCISSFTRSQLMMLSPYERWDKFVLARVGIDTQVFSPRQGKMLTNVFEVLCIGRLTPAKGQHLLIDAADRLAKEGRKIRVRLAGNGPDEESLRNHAARIGDPGNVMFEGGVNQEGIRALYAAADVLCLPSFAEGLPNVLMEAMAMEIPCLTTHIAGVPEMIRDGVDGLLVAPSDLEGLVDALKRLMDDVELRDRLAKNGRLRVLELHDLERDAEDLAAIYASRLES